MKINLPITGQERLFPADKTLVSKTDTKGIITFANRDFVEVSGFTETELVGANHNLIRHPDMPAAAFELMWTTLKRGLPWHGVVKNRCKNGDHYWVDAKVVPIKKGGLIIGYMSVRSAPSRADVVAAEAAYLKVAAAGQTMRHETVADWKKHLSIKNGIPLWILFVTLMMITGGILGISGLKLSNTAIESLYYEEMDPVRAIGRINFLMADNRAQIALALHDQPGAEATRGRRLSEYMQTLASNKDEIDRLWAPYVQRITDATERSLADQYWQARNRYVQDGLLKARQALEAGDSPLAERILLDQVTPLYEQANTSVSALLKHLSTRGQSKFSEVTERNQLIAKVAMAGIALGCLVLIVCGLFFFRVTVLPLHKAVLALENIAEGNLSGAVDTGGYGEPARVMAAVAVMQMHLKVMMHEIRQSSDAIHQRCKNLNSTMMNLSEHSEEQHDRVYQTLDAITESCAGLRTLAENAEQMLPAALGASAGATLSLDAPPAGLEPMPAELLALFGEPPEPSVAAAPLNDPAGVLLPEVSGLACEGDPFDRVQDLAGAARVHALAVEDVAAQLNKVAALIVENRAEVQGAWAASQQLEQTARELEKLVKYFE